MRKRSITSSVVSDIIFSSGVIQMLEKLNPIDLEIDMDFNGKKCLSVTYNIEDASKFANILMLITADQFLN